VVVLSSDLSVLFQECYESPSHLSDLKRVKWLANAILRDLEPYYTHFDTLAAVEGYSMGSANQGKMYARAELSGIIRWNLIECYHVPYLLISPAAVKSLVGVASSKKSRVHKDAKLETARCALERWDISFNDDNVLDGYILARYAVTCCQPNDIKHKVQLELPDNYLTRLRAAGR
jgi:hypothetical protein